MKIITLSFILMIFFTSCKKSPVVNNVVTITGVNKEFAYTGSEIIISGTGFDPIPAKNFVKINDVTARVTQASNTSLTVLLPVNATTGKISASANEGQAVTTTQNFIVVPNIYKTMRLKETVDALGSRYKYTYNANNRLVSVQYYSSTGALNETTVYTYNPDGALKGESKLYENVIGTHDITFNYDNNKLITGYNLTTTTPWPGVIWLINTFALNITYTDGKITKVIQTDKNNVETKKDSYEYLPDGNFYKLNVRDDRSVDYPSTTSYTFMHNVVDPQKLVMPNILMPNPLLIKDYLSSFSSTNYRQIADVDADGKIITLTQESLATPGYVYFKLNYFYEPKQ